MTSTAIQPQIARRLFTVQEYMAMGQAGILEEHERIEPLAGGIVKMAPIVDRHRFATE